MGGSTERPTDGRCPDAAASGSRPASMKTDSPKSRERHLLRLREEDELEQLRLLVSLGLNSQRCHRCDLGVVNLKALLHALKKVFTAVISGGLGREILEDVGKAISGVAHLDPQLRDLVPFLPVPDSLRQPMPPLPGAGERTGGTA
eukprot:gnl/TRDRNA2_/TRDRNA2_173698_c0_seq2.p1 gnl/TRDRNA2_/TRDRNA2_173698_c0~~gnl/TRDRNA2_/TRDRNA2_173698_c0_seq2.p1  ORF type:complete len:146 (-),score=19.13 gnl/TRDRNA2_/TRDRNA2_173698_c0_seq2:113-550(-)